MQLVRSRKRPNVFQRWPDAAGLDLSQCAAPQILASRSAGTTAALTAEAMVHAVRAHHENTSHHRDSNLEAVPWQAVRKERTEEDKRQPCCHRRQHSPSPVRTITFRQRHRSQHRDPHRQRPVRALFAWNQMGHDHRHRDQEGCRNAMHDAQRRSPDAKIICRKYGDA
jgi:hypothetical protein